MATNKLVDEIKVILCDMNKPSRRYSTVWLSLNDDLTGREKYILNVKAEHMIESCLGELDTIFDILYDKMGVKFTHNISRIAVYNSNDQIHCYSGDIMVLEKDEPCSAVIE